MNRIKVIKKNELTEQSRPFKPHEEKLPPKSSERGTIAAVENWVADWRAQNEIKTRLAFMDLARIRLRDSNGL